MVKPFTKAGSDSSNFQPFFGRPGIAGSYSSILKEEVHPESHPICRNRQSIFQ
jgi:hypothetical protein